MVKRVGGTYTSLIARGDFGLAYAGDIFAIEVNGTTILALKNGVLIPTMSVTDASISAIGLAGLGMGAGVDTSASADLDPDLFDRLVRHHRDRTALRPSSASPGAGTRRLVSLSSVPHRTRRTAALRRAARAL